MPLIENVLNTLAKSVLIPLGLTAAAPATDAAIHKKIFGSGVTKLIISVEEMNDIMKIVKSLEESSLLTKGVSETLKNKAKVQKGGFFKILLDRLGASLLGKLLTSKRGTATSQGRGTIRTSEGTFRVSKGTVRADQDF